MKERNINLEKISNARDMGGLHTKDGRIISSGLLIRSANLADATEEDKNLLREKYRLSKIIDLRTETERKEMPDAIMKNVEYMPIPVFDVSVAGISHEKRNIEQISEIVPDMKQLYCKMVADSSCRENLGRAARCVMEHDYSKGSVLWHCTEGKDRCGLLSAGKTEKEAEMIRDIFLAKEEYLDASFSAIDSQYENTDEFLRDGLSIPQELLERFQGSVL